MTEISIDPLGDAIGRLVRERLADDVGPPTRQINVLMTASEAARVERLVSETGWSKRRVVAVATEVLEAALREAGRELEAD